MQAGTAKLLFRLSSAHSKGHSTLSRVISSVKAASEQLTGHSDVLAAQKLVRDEKDDLRVCRNELQAATSRYKELQDEIKSFYIEKSHMQYQEQKRDLSLLKAIHDKEEFLLRKEQELLSRVEECRIRERDCFEELSDAIQESHDRERAQNARMKYFSQIGSLLGAMLGFLGSNMFLRREIRRYNVKQAESLAEIKETLQNSGNTEATKSTRGDVIVAAVAKQQMQTLHSELQKQTRAMDELQALVKDSCRSSSVPEGERALEFSPAPDKEEGRGTNRDLAIVGLMHVMMWVFCVMN